VWLSAKEYIADRLFKSVEKLEYLLHQLLNEGKLIIKGSRKIKNKGVMLVSQFKCTTAYWLLLFVI
jgi:hypothetical protein